MHSDERPELRLSVDWGMRWPISDYTWDVPPDWQEILSPGLLKRVYAWQAFFNEHADLDTGHFGSQDERKWFDLEGVQLLNDLIDEAGHLFEFRLSLWF